MTELGFFNAALTILQAIFPPEAVGKGLQRGFMIGGLAFLIREGVLFYWLTPGSWRFYVVERRKRVAQQMRLGPRVAQLEGEARAARSRLDGLLRELEIRNGNPPSASIHVPKPDMRPLGYSAAMSPTGDKPRRTPPAKEYSAREYSQNIPRHFRDAPPPSLLDDDVPMPPPPKG